VFVRPHTHPSIIDVAAADAHAFARGIRLALLATDIRGIAIGSSALATAPKAVRQFRPPHPDAVPLDDDVRGDGTCKE
jgi:hypothetical protein